MRRPLAFFRGSRDSWCRHSLETGLSKPSSVWSPVARSASVYTIGFSAEIKQRSACSCVPGQHSRCCSCAPCLVCIPFARHQRKIRTSQQMMLMCFIYCRTRQVSRLRQPCLNAQCAVSSTLCICYLFCVRALCDSCLQCRSWNVCWLQAFLVVNVIMLSILP